MLETERVLLRRFGLNDAAALYRLFADPRVTRFGFGPRSEDWVTAWLKQVNRDYDDNGFGILAVINKTTAELIGYCGLSDYPDINGRSEIELGYRLLPSAWGRGYATEAASAVLDHAFDSAGLTRLISLIDPGNKASIRVAGKLGMTYEADVMLEGYTYPDHVYVIEKEGRQEWDLLTATAVRNT